MTTAPDTSSTYYKSPLDGDDGRPQIDARALSEEQGSVSFGLELEFALAILKDNKPDIHPNDKRRARGMIGMDDDDEEFKQSSIEAISEVINERLGHKRCVSVRMDDTDIGSWVATFDDTVDGPQDPIMRNAYQWDKIELRSPAFIFSEEALYEVGTVCTALRNSFRIYATDNKSASVHVHVGWCLNGYSLHTLRKLVALLWIFEKQIFQLVAPFRWNGMYSKPLLGNSPLWRRLLKGLADDETPKVENDEGNDDGPMTDADAADKSDDSVQIEEKTETPVTEEIASKIKEIGLRDIRDSKSITELVSYMVSFDSYGSAPERLAFSFRNLGNDPSGAEQAAYTGSKDSATVEFRLSHATLDPQRLWHWATFCSKLVMFAALVEEEPLFSWLEVHTNFSDVKKYSAIDLLKALKMHEQATYYDGKIWS